MAIAGDFGSDDRRANVHQTLVQYGFEKLQGDLYESVRINAESLARLKKDLDRLTDSYDALRIYQYPLEGTLVISSLKEKKWRKTVVSARSAAQ